MSSIFSKIISGEIPCHKIAESEDFFAFLDINPVNTGHTLVVPKQEIDYLFDLTEATYTELMLFVRKVATAIEKAIPCERIGMTVIGLEVPHAHVHLIPIKVMDDMNFFKVKQNPSSSQLAEIATRIRHEF